MVNRRLSSSALCLTIQTAVGLSNITPERVAAAMQVSDTNPMVGIEGRSTLLMNLADALKSNPLYFGENARPGNMLGKFMLIAPLRARKRLR
jgi:hypothetical protein